MGWRHLHGRAEVDPRDPQPFATCQMCGFNYNQSALVWQMRVAGVGLINSRLLVCRFCKDQNAQFLTPVILPPDPEPIMNARPEPYAIDEGYVLDSGAEE